jgi:xanthine dehydrogenase YagR molybdenum-binding subunit
LVAGRCPLLTQRADIGRHLPAQWTFFLLFVIPNTALCGAFAAGHILNPLLAKSQYVGGLIGGIGMALHERATTDLTSGHIVGDSFADYLIPVHADIPEFYIAMIEEEDSHLPGGIKGIGMLGTAGIQAAIANAVYHATGKRVRSLPIRVENIIE